MRSTTIGPSASRGSLPGSSESTVSTGDGMLYGTARLAGEFAGCARSVRGLKEICTEGTPCSFTLSLVVWRPSCWAWLSLRTGGPRKRSRPIQAPLARKLLEEVLMTYRALPAYSDHGELQVEYVNVPQQGNDKPKTASGRAQLAFARPNKFALNWGPVSILCDGKELTTAVETKKRYVVAAAPKKISLETLSAAPLGDLLQDLDVIHLPYLLTFLLSEEPASEVIAGLQPADHVITEYLDGRKCFCIEVLHTERQKSSSLLFGERGQMRLRIDADSRRLRCIEFDARVPRFTTSSLPLPPLPPVELPPGLRGLEGVVIEGPTFVDVGPAIFPYKTRWVSGAFPDGMPPSSTFTFRTRRL